ERGQITLPAMMRKKYSMDSSTPLIAEETPEGILLRKANLIPMKTYSEGEIQEWKKQDKILPRDKKWLK
ncbi:MAG TPA: hypothetical protein DF383_09390, partial [Deltaproteobacteria bacterium]|nr:hypothetical protein [Deltaproteobacteria bacterium]